VTVQLADGARVAPHVEDATRNGEVAMGAPRLEVALLGLVTVNLWSSVVPTGTMPKLYDDGVSVSIGTAAPVPVRLALTLPEPAVAVIEPLAGPSAVGANFTLATQVELGGMLDAHVVEARTNGPLSVNGDRGTEVAAGLLIVKSWIALRSPITTEPKSWPAGVIVAVGTAAPVPVRLALTLP
jgi:hypothetical protein